MKTKNQITAQDLKELKLGFSKPPKIVKKRRFIEIGHDGQGGIRPDTWDENGQPVTYASESEAQEEVAAHMLNIWEAIAEGRMGFDDIEQPSIHECDVHGDGSITIGYDHKTTWTATELKAMRD